MAKNEQPGSLVSLTEEEKFKSILEYFVKHMVRVCENVSKNKRIQEIAGCNTFTVNDSFRIDAGCLAGRGYKEDRIQEFMENNAGVKDQNSFSCKGEGDQKICISVDSSGGYKSGSYLHFVVCGKAHHRSNSTNINPLFKLEREENNEKAYQFYALQVGPSQNKPTYVFTPLQFTFKQLGLGEPNPTEEQEYNLNVFFDYFIEMRKQELMGSLTYRGMNQLLATHNMILTGAPGTGKTWSAKNIASWIICDMSYEELTKKELKETYKTKNEDFEKRCKVVQFHPSYDYSDFVEGLRPTSGDKTENNTESAHKTTQFGFERVDGVFKEFCKEAAKKWDECHQQIEVFLDNKCVKKEDIDKLTDAIIINDKITLNEEIFPKTNFCTEVPEGINNRNKVVEKTTKKLAKKYVFIIDEINRGELSKIFGELFYSIDPGYRGEDGRVDTQYQNMITDDSDEFKSGFYVPENVYVIGTMNDIDRSVESMDFAMRRRFSFIEVKANEREDMWTEDWRDLAKACMEAINEKIEGIPGLSSAYHIGPAYFKKLNNYMEQQGDDYPDFFKLWDNHLYGVIFEYLRGKKDAEKTMIEIQHEYLAELVGAVNSRFNVGGIWGKKLREKLWKVADKIDNTIEVYTEESDVFKEFKQELSNIKKSNELPTKINELSNRIFKTEFDPGNDLRKKSKEYLNDSNILEDSDKEKKISSIILDLLKTRSQENIKTYLNGIKIKELNLNSLYAAEQKRKQENAKNKQEQDGQNVVKEAVSMSNEILKLSNGINYLMSIGEKITRFKTDASIDGEDDNSNENTITGGDV